MAELFQLLCSEITEMAELLRLRTHLLNVRTWSSWEVNTSRENFRCGPHAHRHTQPESGNNTRDVYHYTVDQ